jgi:hypothetical protein
MRPVEVPPVFQCILGRTHFFTGRPFGQEQPSLTVLITITIGFTVVLLYSVPYAMAEIRFFRLKRTLLLQQQSSRLNLRDEPMFSSLSKSLSNPQKLSRLARKPLPWLGIYTPIGSINTESDFETVKNA